MLAVFDSAFGTRANEIREILFDYGYPCAVCDRDSIGDLLPIGIIITFEDQLDVIRHMPYDRVPVIVFGGGFVNRAQNAVCAAGVEELLEVIDEHICRMACSCVESCHFEEGVFFSPGVFCSSSQIILFGTTLDLTTTERMILLCLIFSGREYRSSEHLAAYCCSDNKTNGNVRVHICSINSKASRRLPLLPVENKSLNGYRFAFAE
ncbi:MAG: hypothetical protein E7638_07600 [Ruminococcaceae bacterium]|nr:hypothetical protein [Oscillospiraceae bacterium]